MAGAKHGPLRLRGGKLWSAWRGWGVVEDFLEEAELEIGRKKKAFQWRPLYCPFLGAVQAASCHGAGGERCGAVVPMAHQAGLTFNLQQNGNQMVAQEVCRVRG